jgi:hypothetical protein
MAFIDEKKHSESKAYPKPHGQEEAETDYRPLS